MVGSTTKGERNWEYTVLRQAVRKKAFRNRAGRKNAQQREMRGVPVGPVAHRRPAAALRVMFGGASGAARAHPATRWLLRPRALVRGVFPEVDETAHQSK